jgi:hypothetical protein
MPPELLAHFKKKAGESKGSEAEEPTESDKEKRKEAVKKARLKLEEKNKKK